MADNNSSNFTKMARDVKGLTGDLGTFINKSAQAQTALERLAQAGTIPTKTERFTPKHEATSRAFRQQANNVASHPTMSYLEKRKELDRLSSPNPVMRVNSNGSFEIGQHNFMQPSDRNRTVSQSNRIRNQMERATNIDANRQHMESRMQSRQDFTAYNERQRAEKSQATSARREQAEVAKQTRNQKQSEFYTLKDIRDPQKRLEAMTERRGQFGNEVSRHTMAYDREIKRSYNQTLDNDAAYTTRDIIKGSENSNAGRAQAVQRLSTLRDNAMADGAGSKTLSSIEASMKILVKQSEKQTALEEKAFAQAQEIGRQQLQKAKAERAQVEQEHPIMSRMMGGKPPATIKAAASAAALVGAAVSGGANIYNEYKRSHVSMPSETFNNIATFKATQQARQLRGLTNFSGEGLMESHGDLLLGNRSSNAGKTGLGITGRRTARTMGRDETDRDRNQGLRDALMTNGLQALTGVGAIVGGAAVTGGSGLLAAPVGMAGMAYGLNQLSGAIGGTFGNKAIQSTGYLGDEAKLKALSGYELDNQQRVDTYTERALASRKIEISGMDEALKLRDYERSRIEMVGGRAVTSSVGSIAQDITAQETKRHSDIEARKLLAIKNAPPPQPVQNVIAAPDLMAKLRTERGNSTSSLTQEERLIAFGPRGSKLTDAEINSPAAFAAAGARMVSQTHTKQATRTFSQPVLPPVAIDPEALDDQAGKQVRVAAQRLTGRASRAASAGMGLGEFDTLVDSLTMANGVGAKVDESGARTERMVQMSRSGRGSMEQLLSNTANISAMGGVNGKNADDQLVRVMSKAVAAGFNTSNLAQSFVKATEAMASATGTTNMAQSAKFMQTAVMMGGQGEKGLAETLRGVQSIENARSNPLNQAMDNIGLSKAALAGGEGGSSAANILKDMPIQKRMEVIKELQAGDYSKMSSEARNIYASFDAKGNLDGMKGFANEAANGSMAGVFTNPAAVKAKVEAELAAAVSRNGNKKLSAQQMEQIYRKNGIELGDKTGADGASGNMPGMITLMQDVADKYGVAPTGGAVDKAAVARYNATNQMNVIKAGNMAGIAGLGESMLSSSLLADIGKGGFDNSTLAAAISGGTKIPGFDGARTQALLGDATTRSKILDYGKEFGELKGKGTDEWILGGKGGKGDKSAAAVEMRKMGAALLSTSKEETLMQAERQKIEATGDKVQMVQMTQVSITQLADAIAKSGLKAKNIGKNGDPE